MKEAQFQAKILKALRQHPALRDAVIWKLNDRYTRGIPDIIVSVKGVTTFFELKKWPEVPTKIQSYWLARLAPRSWVVTSDDGSASFIYSGAKGNQFIVRNDNFKQTLCAIVVRCAP